MQELAKRCAIYTRKSFEPPVGQEITSLESQRKICSSYAASQAHRGWLEIAHHYDDSGRTGANTNRPALQELLGHVESGLVDVILVYKLDRLTRTLFDFVRLMDFLDRHNCALVSITQNFDTSDSLGRLILNVLLTFAQFEREMLSDRMRDRIKVLKQMGRWVGGAPPLGYDVVNQRLIINKKEAEGVRLIYETFLATRSPTAAVSRLRDVGFRRKVWKARTGNVYGGGPILLSSIYHILRNPIYAGKICNNGAVYEGIHAPIIDQATFEAVQVLAAEMHVDRKRRDDLLSGLLYDSSGRQMLMRAHPFKDHEIRYYVSHDQAWAKRQKVRRMRASASELEALVIASLSTLLLNRERLRAILLDHGLHGAELDRATRKGNVAARTLNKLSARAKESALKALLERVEVANDHITLVILLEELRRFLAWDGVGIFSADEGARQRNGAVHMLREEGSFIRAQRVYALPVSEATGHGVRDHRLLALLDEAESARALMIERRDLGVPELAEAQGCKMARFARLIRLTYLAPDIVLAIRDGHHPAELTRRKLTVANLPLEWATQRTLLGFPPKPERLRNPDRQTAIGREK